MAEFGAFNHSSGTFDHDLGAFNHSSGAFDHDLSVAAARGKDQGAVVYHTSSMGAGRVEDLLSVPPPADDPGAFNYSSVRSTTAPARSTTTSAWPPHADDLGAFNHSSGAFDHDLSVAAARGKDQGAVVYHISSMGAGRVEDLLGVPPPADEPGALNYSSGTFAHQPDMGAGRVLDLLGVLQPTNDPGAFNHSSGAFDHDLGVAAARGKDQGAVVYHISSMGAGRVEDLLSVPPPADDPGAFNYSCGTFAHQPDMDAGRGVDLLGVLPPTNDPGAFNYNSFRRFLPVMGIVAASSAITGLAVGTATPAAGFGLFVLLLGGLSLVTLRVLGA